MNILSTIGNTPLVELPNLSNNKKVRLFAKLEGQNPGGSVKDRAALSMIIAAEEQGLLNQESTIIEATSGNTGIALALIASLKNYKIELVMPENSTIERVLNMKAFGAKVTLTDASLGMEGAIDYVNDKLKRDKSFISLNQFQNKANPLAHYQSTAPEIWQDSKGKITHFVSAMGTTGTIMGVSKYLKEQNKNIKIVGVRPKEGAKIPGIRRWPKEYLPTIFDEQRVDQFIDVSQEDAENTAKILAIKEGIFCGISSGGAVHAALKLAESINEGYIVSIICDRADKYFSSNLFKN